MQQTPLRMPFSVRLALMVLHMPNAADTLPLLHNIVLRAAPSHVLLVVPCPKIRCYFYCFFSCPARIEGEGEGLGR